MIGYRLVDADFCRYFLQHPVAVGDIGHKQYEVRSRDLTFVTGDDALRDAHNLITNGVLVFCRFLTIHKSPSNER